MEAVGDNPIWFGGRQVDWKPSKLLLSKDNFRAGLLSLKIVYISPIKENCVQEIAL